MESYPWIEKYRPKDIKDIKGQKILVETLKMMVNSGHLPNLIFHGSAGTGKTSTILSLVRYIYGMTDQNVLELNASDDRGIGIVREDIKDFIDKVGFFDSKLKLVILDEADAMTEEAQNALKYIMEKHNCDTRFCLICNYYNKIIPSIKSRCCIFRFLPLEKKYIKFILEKICEDESLEITSKNLTKIYKMSNGDVRKSINLLQSISIKNKKISGKIINSLQGYPSDLTFKKFYELLFDDKVNYKKCLKYIRDKFEDEGFTMTSLINMIGNEILESNNIKLLKYLKDISELEYKVNQSTFSEVYLYGLIAIFKK